jgi:1-deoxy-D-xylulose 5-phosphate reductoisomerase
LLLNAANYFQLKRYCPKSVTFVAISKINLKILSRAKGKKREWEKMSVRVSEREIENVAYTPRV